MGTKHDDEERARLVLVGIVRRFVPSASTEQAATMVDETCARWKLPNLVTLAKIVERVSATSELRPGGVLFTLHSVPIFGDSPEGGELLFMYAMRVAHERGVTPELLDRLRLLVAAPPSPNESRH